jgi:hypothetical protein
LRTAVKMGAMTHGGIRRNLVVTAVLAAGLAVAACQGGHKASGGLGSPPDPHTDAAVRAVATETFTRYTATDFAGAWQFYDAAGKTAISQADYVRLNETCPSLAAHRSFTVGDIRIEGDTATVRITIMVGITSLSDSYVFHLESDGWRIAPTATALIDYRRGVDATVAARRKAGTC